MDKRKMTRITRDRLMIADFEVWALDGSPADYRTFKLPRKFKVWWQFQDPIRKGFWSVELQFEIENGNSKLLETTHRGLTYKRGLLIDGNGGNYIYRAPTEEPAGWQYGLVKNNLTNLMAHSLESAVRRYTHLGGKKWKLEGTQLSEEEFQEIRAEVALKKRELFTPEKAEAVKRVLDEEKERAQRSGSRYRGNEVIAEVFKVSLKTAEKWSARVRVSAQKSRKNKKQGRGSNAKSKKARR